MAKKNAMMKAKSNLPASPDFMHEDAGTGFENTNSEDFAIPFLRILQKLSPAVDEESSQFVAGAKPGMLMDTVSKALFKSDIGAIVVPVSYERSFIEWKTRKNGGGFVNKHAADCAERFETTRDEGTGKDMLPNGNELQDTRSFYVMLIDPATGIPKPCLISMVSTQTKKSKTWLSQMDGLKIETKDGIKTAPIFSSSYKITTAIEQKDDNKWYGFIIERESWVSQEIYMAAKVFRDSIMTGDVIVKHTADDEEM